MTLVFAHRGASAALAEHTLAGYKLALDAGVDGVECDVRLTRDGHLVCVHDRKIDRVSDGRGPVAGYTLAQLRAFDFGSWHSSGQPAEVLALDDLLEQLRDAGRPVQVLIETKHPNRFGKAVEHRLRATLARHGLINAKRSGQVQVTVMSFSPLAVRRTRLMMPSLTTVMLLAQIPHRLVRTPVSGPGLELVKKKPELVPRLRAGNRQVFVWTVNDLADVDLMLSLGVDGIITDRPREVLTHLGR